MKNANQSPSAVVMVRPHHFMANPETAADNVFQQKNLAMSAEYIAAEAGKDVQKTIEILRSHGVTVHAFDDFTKDTPDSVFPNNWFTTHEDGTIGIFPMYCENRRKEKNPEIIKLLSKEYQVNKVIDYSILEEQHLFLEGTGSMVLDHSNRYAYAVISNRMSERVLNQFCKDFHYQPVPFTATDDNNVAVYHTNVLMSMATNFVLIGLDCVKNLVERTSLIDHFQESDKEIIELTYEQICKFAGNALELSTPNGNILAMSTTAYNSLTESQILMIENYVKIVPINVSTIELAGGSIRCMLAGIHLSTR
jgi:hypothetical protein